MLSPRISNFLSLALLSFSLHTALRIQHVSAQNTTCNSIYPNIPNTTYPNQAQICTVFSHLTGANPNGTAFFQNVADNVNWTIEGTHPLAGEYLNKTVFEAALVRISATGSAASPLLLSLENIIGGGDEQWSVQELRVLGVCINGLIFDNRYAWVTRWNTQGIIVQARAYLDSTLVTTALVANELGLFTYSDLRDSISPFVTLSAKELAAASGL